MLQPEYPLTTRRLRLRPFADRDHDYLVEVTSRPDVLRYLYDEPRTPEEAAALLTQRANDTSIAEEGDRLRLVVEVVATGDTVGDVVLVWSSAAHSQGEISFVFHPDHHGQGYATEAAGVLLALGFNGLRLHRIIGRCDGRNAPSARVMEKLGMRREAHLVENERVKGEWTDELIFAILEEEWRERTT